MKKALNVYYVKTESKILLTVEENVKFYGNFYHT